MGGTILASRYILRTLRERKAPNGAYIFIIQIL